MKEEKVKKVVNRDLLSRDEKDLFITAQKESDILKERLFELHMLYSLSKSFNLTSQLDVFFDNTMNLLKDLVGINYFCLLLLDEESGELKTKICEAGNLAVKDANDFKCNIGEGIPGIVALKGIPMIIKNVNKEKRIICHEEIKKVVGASMSVPTQIKRWQGYRCLKSP